MTQQAAENLTKDKETTDSFIFGSSTEDIICQSEKLTSENTAGDYISRPQLFEKLAYDLFIPDKYKEKLVDTAHSQSNINEKLTKVATTPRAASHSFSILQEWEGYVVAILKDTFKARLTDVTRHSSIEEEEADFPLDDLDDADRATICEGAIFRWVIGYRRNLGGTKERSSRIVFRNLPLWTKKELNKNMLDAIEWEDQLKLDDNSKPSEVRSA